LNASKIAASAVLHLVPHRHCPRLNLELELDLDLELSLAFTPFVAALAS
jgi:hypothetical protein